MKTKLRTLIALCFLFLALFAANALADGTLTLPAGLKIVDEEAFYGVKGFQNLVIPEGVTEIRSRAFANSSVRSVSFPMTLTSIAEDAFDGCGMFSASVTAGSYAYRWCLDHGYIDMPDPTPAEYFTYNTLNGLYVEITGYTGPDSIVVVPEEIDDYLVQRIANDAFEQNDTIESVLLPDTVTEIGDYAFYRCAGLASVDVGQNVVKIGVGAFKYCTSLIGVQFPDTLKETGQSLFYGCSNLEYFDYPINWEIAGSRTIEKCNKINELVMPEGATLVPEGAFACCDNLTSVTFSSSVVEIEKDAFRECSGLTSISIPGNVERLSGFYDCCNLSEVTLHSGLIAICDNAFVNCVSLTNVDFPEGLESIGRSAFEGCENLKAARLPDSVNEILSNAFNGCVNMTEFSYPKSLSNVWTNEFDTYLGYIFKDCKKLRTISVPEGVVSIPDYMFKGANYLRSVALPSTLRSIGKLSFAECVAITDMAFPDGLESIGRSAFEGCENLKAARLPDSVNEILSDAFNGCVNMTAFTYPRSMNNVWTNEFDTYLGFIFKDCKKLETIIVPEGVVSIPNYMFKGANYLKNVILPSTLRSIGKLSFAECVAITDMAFPDGLESIGRSAFEGCENLKAARLPDSVNEILSDAFNGCVNMTAFTYPRSLNNVWTNEFDVYLGFIFKDCEKLETITVPEGVISIPNYIFKGSNKLKNVILPSTIESIGKLAFADCLMLEKTYLGYNVTHIENNAFENCPALTIWTEYGAYALQYAKDNGIPYYYLTPDGVNSPSGTLYKGDSYALYGYARASVPLTNITATIWDSTGKNVVQTISVNPATTDYNLSGTVNTNLLFGVLPLGSYRYTLTAKTAVSEEVWANNAFKIVPPPLRVSVSGLDNLTGTVGNDYVWSGMVYANYPMTSLTITLKNVSSGTTYPSYSCSPNSMAYSLSNVTGISFADKPTGNYQLTLVVCGNGETRTFNTFFSIGKYDGNISGDVFNQLVSFAGNASNRSLFDKYNEGSSFLGSLTISDTILMAVNFRSQMCIDVISQQLREDHLSQFMIKRYKKEIAAIIDDVDPQTKLTSVDSTYNDLIDSMTSNLRITFTLNENDSLVNKRMMNMSRIINFQLDKIERLCTLNSWIGDAREYYTAFMQNYENSMMILEVYSGYSSTSSPELKKAVEELADDYDSKVFKAMNILTNMLIDKLSKELYSDALKLFQAATDLIDKKLTGQYGNYSIMWSATNFAIDATMEFYNFDDIADSLMNTIVQVETFGQALDSYHQAFDKVRNGDTSTSALNRLAISYQLCCSAGTRMYGSLADTAWYRTNFGENTTFMDLYSELWRMEYNEPFNNWR